VIIDFHTHVPPESQWALFLQHCRASGTTLALTSSLGSWARYPDEADVRAANDEARRLAEFARGVVRWFAYLNPRNDNWAAELQRALAEGACGVKLWVSLKDPVTGSLERVPPVLDAALRLRLPVLIHTYQRTDENLPGEITVAEFAALARQFPEVPMIAAHAGGNWRHSLGLLREIANAYVDICGGYPEAGMVEALVADLGAERVLYGSDALGRSCTSQIAKVTLAALPEADKERILCGNSARLLGLAAAELAASGRVAAAAPTLPDLGLPAFDEDHFVYAGQWPFREGPCLTPAELDLALAAVGIRRAYAADAASVYALDLLAANRAFRATVEGLPRVAPLAALAPYAPNWQPVLAEARGRFAGGIVYPFLHAWRLDDPRYAPFFRACADARCPLWINAGTGDARCRHRGTVCRDVTAAELVAFVQAAPPNAYVVQGAAVPLIQAVFEHCPEARSVRFEISRLTDTSLALANVVQRHGWERLVLGSEYPFRDLRTVAYTARVLCGG
jgi:predicted TIM-barrel fold metal-dependent hydrolase